jgi:hypothetical protein
MEYAFNYQVNKHGSHCGFTDFEAWVDSLTQYELLNEISFVMGENNRMRHVYAELLHALAENSSLKIEYSNGFEWRIVENPSFASNVQYRIHDPYRPFKEAIAKGEAVQFDTGTQWVDLTSPYYLYAPERYRLKTKTAATVTRQEILLVNKDFGHSQKFFAEALWDGDKVVELKIMTYESLEERK